MSKSRKMTSKAASRIQSATAKANGGKVTKKSFPARAAKAAKAATKNSKQKKGAANCAAFLIKKASL